jgi:hypothetical protein
MCEMEMSPGEPLLYAFFSLVATTAFFVAMLAHRSGGADVDIRENARAHLLTAPAAASRTVLDQNVVEVRLLACAAAVGCFEQLMMVAGVLSRSVAWSKNFLLVEILQDVR